MMLGATHARGDGIGWMQSESRAWIPEQQSSLWRHERNTRFRIEVLEEQRGAPSAAQRVMPSRLAVLREDGPADVVRIPNAAACDRPDRPGGRQTRMNAPPETTEELNSFQRAGRAPPEDEFGRWHSTDRLPPGQDPVGGLEIGCRRNLGHEPHPLVPDVAQLREIVQPDRLRAPPHALPRQSPTAPRIAAGCYLWSTRGITVSTRTEPVDPLKTRCRRLKSLDPGVGGSRVHGFQIHRRRQANR